MSTSEQQRRLTGIALMTGSAASNQLGAVESGWTAAWFGPVFSVAGGGVATILVVATCAVISVQLRKWKQ